MISYVPQDAWGWMIATYLFLGGLGGAVGALGIGIDRYVKRRPWLGTFSALSAFVILSIGSILLVLDLLQPLKTIYFFRNPGSWIFWGIVFISGFMAATVIYAIPNIKEWPLIDRVAPYLAFLDRWQHAAGTVAVVLGFAVTIYTGFLLSTVPAIAFWHSAALPLLFTVSAFSTGCAYLLLALWFIPKHNEGWLTEALERTDAVLIITELIVLGALFNTARCCPMGASYSMHFLLSKAGFVVGFLLLGLVVPLAGELYAIFAGHHPKHHKLSTTLIPILSLLVIIGGYLLRQYVVQAGVYTYPW